MRLLLLSVCVCAAVGSAVGFTADRWHVTESRPETVHFTVHLHHFHDMAEECRAVSDPNSPRFRQFLSVEQLTDLVAHPNVAAISQRLTAAGATSVQPTITKDALRVVMPAPAAAELFSVPAFHTYRASGHTDIVHEVVRSPSKPVLPEWLQGVTRYLSGIHDMPFLGDRQATPSPSPSPPPSPSPASAPSPLPGPFAACSPGFTQSDFAVELFAVGPEFAFLPLTAAVIRDTPLPAVWTAQWQRNGGPWQAVNLTSSDYYFPQGSNSGWAMAPNPFRGVATANDRFIVGLMFPSWPSTGSTACAVKLSVPGVANWAGVASAPFVTPKYIKEFLNVSSAAAAASHPNASQSCAEFGPEGVSESDLETFLHRMNITGSGSRKGFFEPASFEGNMDAQIMVGMSPNTDFQVVHRGSFVLEWATDLGDQPHPPLINSISYAATRSELSNGGHNATAYYNSSNVEFQKLCARGVSVFVASGDGGATNDGHGSASCAFNSLFPSSSPWVTTVSATLAATGDGVTPRPGRADGYGEVPVSLSTGALWTTGGGFADSPINGRAWYQTLAVEKYLASTHIDPQAANLTAYRAYPDLATLGRNSPVVMRNQTLWYGDGTSMATPTVASLFTVINNLRMVAGKPPVGFVNPVLYSLQGSGAFYDVPAGYNNSCGALQCTCALGYNSAAGFDVVTGLGTPVFSALSAAFLKH